MFRRSLKLVGGAHKLLYRASGGRFGGRMNGMPVLLLTTKGTTLLLAIAKTADEKLRVTIQPPAPIA